MGEGGKVSTQSEGREMIDPDIVRAEMEERKMILRAIIRTAKRANLHRLGWQLQEPEMEAKREAAREQSCKTRVRYPAWGPESLREGFYQVVADEGEHEAAQWLRWQKYILNSTGGDE